MNATTSALARFGGQDGPDPVPACSGVVLDVVLAPGSTSRPYTRTEPDRGMALPPGIRIGDIIAGKYRIKAILGTGAMGTVVSAYHLLLAQLVAIKFLNPERVAA